MFVESTFFFSDTGKLLMWFLLFKFKRLSLWEEKMKKAQQKKKGCNLLSENLKLQVQKRDKQLCFFSGFAFFFFFAKTCLHSAQKLASNEEWHKQCSCCSRERTIWGMLSEMVTATAATTNILKVSPVSVD